MDKYISASLSAGIMHPSSSVAAEGSFFVDKKDKTLCPCIDYRGLKVINKEKNRYPLPLNSSAFKLLQGAKMFTKLEKKAYHLEGGQREGEKWKTAFNTPSGHYEYLVSPKGITNFPAVFHTVVNNVLFDTLNSFEFVTWMTSLSPPQKRRHMMIMLPGPPAAPQPGVSSTSQQYHSWALITSQNSIQMDPAKVCAVTSSLLLPVENSYNVSLALMIFIDS